MTELMKKAIAKIDAEGEKGGTNQNPSRVRVSRIIHRSKTIFIQIITDLPMRFSKKQI